MRTSFLTLPLLVALSLAPSSGSSDFDPRGGQDPVEQEKTRLQQSMETLNQGHRGLRKLVPDPVSNKRDLLETLASMEQAILTALGELPPDPGLDKVPEEARALWHVSYKQTMARLLQAVLAMESATLSGDAEALGSAYGELGDVKQLGHEKFRDL